MLEKIVHRNLYSFFEAHEILSDAQFGFRTKRSTVSLLLSAVNDWADSLNHRHSVHCVFIDFAKAFDSVAHKRLLIKLKYLGVNGALLTWFRSFLTTRRQRVVINGKFSNWQYVSSGVPQGSILGPLLFITYINDIPSAVSSNVKIFADDVTLYATVQTVQDCQILQDDLNSISRWCDMWQLRLNPSKCEVLCITNKRSPLYFDYKIGGCSLHWSSSVKYLGIYINSKLNWNNHCAHMAAKATVQRFLIFCEDIFLVAP